MGPRHLTEVNRTPNKYIMSTYCDRKYLTASSGVAPLIYVNYVRAPFTCGPQVQLPAFAGNFAHASFKVKLSKFQGSNNQGIFDQKDILCSISLKSLSTLSISTKNVAREPRW